MSIDILKNSISNICIYFYNNSLLWILLYSVVYEKFNLHLYLNI